MHHSTRSRSGGGVGGNEDGGARGEDACGGEYGRVRMVAIGEGERQQRAGGREEEGQLSRGTVRWLEERARRTSESGEEDAAQQQGPVQLAALTVAARSRGAVGVGGGSLRAGKGMMGCTRVCRAGWVYGPASSPGRQRAAPSQGLRTPAAGAPTSHAAAASPATSFEKQVAEQTLCG